MATRAVFEITNSMTLLAHVGGGWRIQEPGHVASIALRQLARKALGIVRAVEHV